MLPVENLHVREFVPLFSPHELHQQLPLSETAARTVVEARRTIQRIMQKQDPRLLVVIGPCSIHDPTSALEYAERLYEAHQRFSDRLFLVMRTYLEKPRTTTGWRGFLNDPHIDGSFDMATGLRRSRELLLKINALGLPTATEMLDPISPQYLNDVISFAAIGARTTESQTHRALASGLSMPIGFKNNTDGNTEVAINAMISMRNPHSFFGIDQTGRACVVKTQGNPDGIIILRGSRAGINYDRASVAQAEAQMQAAGLSPALMVDCSHANAQADYTRQELVWNTVLEQRLDHDHAVIGMMVESHLHDGKQPIPEDLSQLRYGVSITDACVGWETTERMLAHAHTALTERA
ncbi:MAG: 3-deoxy-7-phosphoheptulonate synthase [Chloroflexaceae bacterium]|nr:3-deoxy-7-phosphoheptulonate synthase [Chloroflexaceae bacterium]NJL34313.1 3-deoxy-7-phosphoheptulonate synthase [Chloroflexaceae bacterium]NJO05980.1 3-deoxy-7-phosphoheptulonate synthase [Chloroflexaceae bacterium]